MALLLALEMCFTKNKCIIKQTKVPKKRKEGVKIKAIESVEKFQIHTRVREFCYLLFFRLLPKRHKCFVLFPISVSPLNAQLSVTR